MTNRTCSIEGCPNLYRARGWCSTHYQHATRASQPPCSVDGCETPTRARGFCATHWTRWRRNGDPHLRTSRPPIVRDHNARFDLHVERGEDCWFWTGFRDKGGYGRFQLGKQAYMAHRFAYERAVGPIPDDKELDHLCQRRHCVNPDHLEAVTRVEHRNRRRYQTHCIRGHERTATNVRANRSCRTCSNDKRRLRRMAGRAG